MRLCVGDSILPIAYIFFKLSWCQGKKRCAYLHHHIQHGTRIRDGDRWFLWIGGFNFEVLGEGGRQDAPDSVSVQLQRTSVEKN